jgi:hypothetical protein
MSLWGAGAFENGLAQVLLANLAHWNRDSPDGYGPEWVTGQLRVLFGTARGTAVPFGLDRRHECGCRAQYEESGTGHAHRLVVAALVIARAFQGADTGGNRREVQDLAASLNRCRGGVVDRILRGSRPAGQVSDWLETAGDHCDLITYEAAAELLPAVVVHLTSRRQAIPFADAASLSCQAEITSMLEAAEFCLAVLPALHAGE